VGGHNAGGSGPPLATDTAARTHRREWLVFLHDAEVPPTNNHAERMLWPAAITRKVGGCNKTLLGALVHSLLASLMVSCKRQSKRFLDLARRLWQARSTSGYQPGQLASLLTNSFVSHPLGRRSHPTSSKGSASVRTAFFQ
jgi:hypothetical protein